MGMGARCMCPPRFPCAAAGAVVPTLIPTWMVRLLRLFFQGLEGRIAVPEEPQRRYEVVLEPDRHAYPPAAARSFGAGDDQDVGHQAALVLDRVEQPHA